MKFILLAFLVLSLSSCAIFKSKKVSFSGGTGLSIEDAIVIRASNEEKGVQAERDYFELHYPHYSKQGQDLVEDKGKSFDVIKLTSAERKPTVTLYFDISSFYGKL